MEWKQLYPADRKPSFEQISGYIGTPLFTDLCGFIEGMWAVKPQIEYSRCGGAPGWNVKYKKSGRTLCTLYAGEGCFTCLVSIGAKEAGAAEAVLPKCTSYVRELYRSVKPLNGARWLMIRIGDEHVLSDAEQLVSLRAKRRA